VSCWRISLTTIPNRVYRFTDYSEDLTFPTGEVFQAMDGMEGTAMQRNANLRGLNRDTRGVISDTQITDDDLQAGLFNNAYVEEYLVDTRLAGIGPIEVVQYWIQAVSFEGSQWAAEIDGVTSGLKQPAGDFWGPVCRVEVFSTGPAKCNVPSPGTFAQNGTMLAPIIDRRQFDILASNPLWQANGYGQDGWVSFLNGPNAGFTIRIKTYTYVVGPNATVIFQGRTPYTISAGDAVTMLPGCNKRVDSDCKLKFNNVLNFQGEPFIPGGDLARKGATIK
jgi:uncharacterized phage protein (TIGR02218 family)